MLTKKNIPLVALMLVILILFTGCGMFKKAEEEPIDDDITTNLEGGLYEENVRETLVYYQDDAGYLVPVMRKIPWEEGIAKATLRKMIDSPEEQQDLMAMGLRALLPANTEIRGMSISEDGLAKVDFNEAVMNCQDALAESNMVQGIVLTLTEFPTINRVQFMVDGKIIKNLTHGTDISQPITAGDVNLEMGIESDVDGARVTVFFHSTSASQFDYLVPVTRVTSSSMATLETALNEWMAGPLEVGNLRLDLPVGTSLLGVQMDNGIAYINFSREFNELAKSPHSEMMVLKSLVMTAKQFPEIMDVKILVEGKDYEGFDTMSTMTFANEY